MREDFGTGQVQYTVTCIQCRVRYIMFTDVQCMKNLVKCVFVSSYCISSLNVCQHSGSVTSVYISSFVLSFVKRIFESSAEKREYRSSRGHGRRGEGKAIIITDN